MTKITPAAWGSLGHRVPHLHPPPVRKRCGSVQVGYPDPPAPWSSSFADSPPNLQCRCSCSPPSWPGSWCTSGAGSSLTSWIWQSHSEQWPSGTNLKPGPVTRQWLRKVKELAIMWVSQCGQSVTHDHEQDKAKEHLLSSQKELISMPINAFLTLELNIHFRIENMFLTLEQKRFLTSERNFNFRTENNIISILERDQNWILFSEQNRSLRSENNRTDSLLQKKRTEQNGILIELIIHTFFRIES